jgi:PKD repeat protein
LFFHEQLTGVVAGTYEFKLTVADEQGLTGTETVTINVIEDPLIMNLVEVVLTAQASNLSQRYVSQSEKSLKVPFSNFCLLSSTVGSTQAENLASSG